MSTEGRRHHVRVAGVREEGANRWLPMAGFVLVSSANQMLWLNFAPITTGSASRLGVSSSTIGLLSEIFPILYVVLAIPVGVAVDRWFRPTLAVGATLTAAGALMRLAGHGFGPVLAGQLVVAAAQPAVLNAVTGMATRTLRPASRATGIAVGSAGTFLGFVLALGLAFGAAGLHHLLVVSAAYAVAGAVVLLPALRAVRPAPAGRSTPDAPTGGGVVPAGRESIRQGLAAVWAVPTIRAITGAVFLGFGVFVALTTWVQTLLEHSGVGARTADRLLVVMVLAGVVSSVAAPTIVARRRAQATAVVVAATGGGAACLLLAVTPGVATGYVSLVLFGLVLLPALPVLLELIEQRAGERPATATGLLWLAGNAGGVVVAVVVQLVVGTPVVAFVLMAVTSIAALPFARRLRQLREEPDAAAGA